MKITENHLVRQVNDTDRKLFSNSFLNIEKQLKTLLLTIYQLAEDTTDKEVLKKMDDLITSEENILKENNYLKYERARLIIDKLINDGSLNHEQRLLYTKLATVDYDTTIDLITRSCQLNLELNELLKLCSHELYMQGKFLRLKELDINSFKLRHKEYFGVHYSGK